MRKLIPIVIMLLIAASCYAVDLTVFSIDVGSLSPLPYANVAITIGGVSWLSMTDVNGLYTFTYPGTSEIPWTSYVTKTGWSWYYPANGYVTTSISQTLHRHFLIR
jgi:hypothetical protein